MNKLTVACLLAAAAAAAVASPAGQHALPSFAEYCEMFGKVYADASEHARRATLYEARLVDIVGHNTLNKSSHLKGVNHMTDWTEEERAALFGFDKTLHRHVRSLRNAPATPMHARVQSRLPIPDSVDWAAANATSPVKNQGGCGSCWAFAGASAIESDVYLSTGKLPVLAPQLYVDCVANSHQCGGSGGCQGSVPELLFEFAAANGARNESDYEYTGKEGVCMAGRTTDVARIAGYVDVRQNDYVALMLATAKTPVVLGVAASAWSDYSKGVLKFSECDAEINHAVLLVGYGTDSELGDYWKVQNSWGPSWGEDGFIRLERNSSDGEKCMQDKNPLDGMGCKDGPPEVTVCGTCGLLSGPSYPVGGYMLDE